MVNINYRKLFQFLSTLVIWGAMTAAWGFVWYRYYSDIIQFHFYRRGNWAVIGIYCVILYIANQLYGGYRVGYYRRGDLIFSGLLSMIVTNIITYFQTLLIGRQLPSVVNVTPIFWLTAADFFAIWIWATWANKLYLHFNPPRHLLLIYGGSSMAQSLIRKMAERDDKYIIQEAVNIDEGMYNIIDRVANFEAVLICDVKSGYRNQLLKYCYDRNIRVYMTPKISDILIRGSESIHLFDTPLLLSRNNGLSVEQRIVKRLTDVVLAALGLCVAWPFMLVVAICVKLGDGGPVIYKQNRLTEGGREFMLYKFRTMVTNAEEKGGAQLAKQNDSRVTPVGRFIRKIRMDELPQLINILKGDMSVVGPRPERPELAEECKRDMEEFDFRLKVKAGLTGYAQVLGKYNTTPYDKLKLDLIYITNYSFLLDLKLILQTVKILFMGSSTEGVAVENEKDIDAG